MPAKLKRPNNAITLSETVIERLQGVPWPLSAWLECTRAESMKLHTYRTNDPELDRLRTKRLSNWIELGTYTAKATKTDVIADVLDGMARVR